MVIGNQPGASVVIGNQPGVSVVIGNQPGASLGMSDQLAVSLMAAGRGSIWSDQQRFPVGLASRDLSPPGTRDRDKQVTEREQ